MRTRSISLNGHKLLSNGDKRPRTPGRAHRNGDGNHRSAAVAVPPRSITSAVAKFIVGFSAGASLVFLPPMVTTLTFQQAAPSDVVLFTTTRIAMGVVVAIFIAIITTIQEYQKPARPSSIFMRALALPGLVIGSWQSLADNTRLRDTDAELHAAEELASEISGISEIPAAARAAEPIAPAKTSGLTPDTGMQVAALLPPDVLRAASVLLGPSVEEPRFLIVVDRRPDSASAATRAQELRPSCCPRASYLQERPGGGWYVLESTESRTRTESLRRAIAIRKTYPELKLDPQLLALKK